MTKNNVVPLRKTDPLAKQLRIAVGKPNSGYGKAKNVLTTWGKFLEKIKKPAVDNITAEQYEKLSKDQKLAAKNKGYYISGQFEGERRKNNKAQQKVLLTFDVDFGSERTLAEFEMGENWLGDFEYVMHTTRSHKTEAPKLRVSIPLDKPLPPDEWMAVSRIVASKIDDTMGLYDPVSFRSAQLMFWPSINSDSTYSFYHNATGKFLSGAEILADWPGWEDISQLPRRATEDLTHAGKPVVDPHEKEGVIGAFCRAYSISEVIETWLSDIYEEAQGEDFTGTRYTYRFGSSFGGVRVYDDKLLWSDHATDPAAGHQQNAFDLLRIHKFGDEDTDAESGDDKSVSKRPSFKAMRKFALADEETRSELAAAQYDPSDILDDISEDEDEEAPPEDSISDADAETAWMGRMDLTDRGEYRSTLHNVMLVLRHDKRFKGLIGFNELAQKVVIRRRWRAKYHKIDYPAPGPDGAEWTDVMSAKARAIFDAPKGKGASGFGLYIGKDLIESAIDAIAFENRFHPVRDYLNSLQWDGKPRLETAFVRHLGAEDTDYTREVCKLMFIAAVARTMAPGCKFDYVVILEGEQGLRKSTYLRALAGNRWFGDLRIENYANPQKLEEAISGHWIMEIPDLAHFNKHDANVMKALFSAQHDRVRRSYDRRSGTYLRHVIFTATTNEDEYLNDPTGNRRYLPIRCGSDKINIEAVKEERDQLWAEAVTLFREMADATAAEDDYPLYITNETAIRQAKQTQSDREVDEGFVALAERICRWLDMPVSPEAAQPGYDASTDLEDPTKDKVHRMVVVAADIFRYAMNGDLNNYTKSVIRRIGSAMKLLRNSWVSMPQSRSIIEGKKVNYYKRRSPVPGDDI